MSSSCSKAAVDARRRRLDRVRGKTGRQVVCGEVDAEVYGGDDPPLGAAPDAVRDGL